MMENFHVAQSSLPAFISSHRFLKIDLYGLEYMAAMVGTKVRAVLNVFSLIIRDLSYWKNILGPFLSYSSKRIGKK